jgi:hypothetical protein
MRVNLAVLKTIKEEGSIEWEDHSYSSICDAGELQDPTFGFVKRLLPNLNFSFKDYFIDHPVQKPLKSLWDAIGRTSSGSIVLLSIKSEHDHLESERLDAVAHLVAKGVPVKYVDLILINDSFLNQNYEQMKFKWSKLLDERNRNLSAGSSMYSCFMSLTGSLDPEESL